DEDLLMLTFHYCLLTNGFKVFSLNQPSEILKLRTVEDSVPMYYVFNGLLLKCHHDTVVTENPLDIEFGTNHGYEIECKQRCSSFVGEFIIDDTLNKHNAGTENSVQNSLKDIPENKRRLIDQQVDHEPRDGHVHP
ncbi:unnamed protein product, partial [Rotaria magnacalcarata]